MSFKFVTGGNQGIIYAVTDTGDLLFFRDLARDGTTQWAASQVIGTGWQNFLRVFAGGDGVIYAIAQNGDLYYYRDLAQNGTASWDFDGAGQVIGTGWQNFLEVFSGGDGIIYAIDTDGDLLFYRDLARNGTAQWAAGAGQTISNGWQNFGGVFADDDGVIYAIAQNGDLLFYRDLARNGTAQWAFGGAGQVIGSGWQNFSEVFSGGDGVIYAITPDGFLLFYRDLARDGTFQWAYGGAAQTIGSGWFIQPQTTATLEGYCAPLSVSPGEEIEFMISARNEFRVTYLRLKQQPDGSVGIPLSASLSVPAGLQPFPEDPWQNGCGWNPTLTLQIPPAWPSGIYSAECVDTADNRFHIVFIVRPAPDQRRDFAVLVNINTWNAYNGWGGRSKYSSPPGAILSFLRPNPAASPLDDGNINHLTRAELWILNWLEDEGYQIDLYSDYDFHAGIDGLADYKALLVSTHPEYWTLPMLDNLESYIQGGGCVLYLGGNGLFEEVAYDATADALILLQGDPNIDRGLCYLRNLDPPRPERAVLGVAYRYDNYMTFGPFQVQLASHRFFAGTGLANGDLIGQLGINGGGASGWEMDTSLPGNAPPGVIVSATGADDRGLPPANLQLLARGANPGGFGADMTYYDNAGGGFVFTAGSISFGGSLVQDTYLQAIMRNVLNECLNR